MQAGLAKKAIAYLLKAGQRGMTHSAMAEALVQLTQALRLVSDLPAGADRDELEIDLQVALGGAFAATKGFAAPEVESSYQRARELCRGRPDHFDLPAVLCGLHVHHQHRSGMHIAHVFAEELLHLAERQRDKAACAVGHYRFAQSSMWTGDYQLALTHFQQAIASYDRAEPPPSVILSLSDVRVASLNFIALVLSWRGDLEQAVTRSRTALAAAQALRHPYTLCHVLHLNCWLHQILCAPSVVKDRADMMLKLTEEHGFSLWRNSAEFWQGWALAALGQVVRGSADMRKAIAAYKAKGMLGGLLNLLSLLGDVYTRAGNPAGALVLLTEALELLDRTHERWFEAELHRLRAEALLANLLPDAAEAEASLCHAVAVAREQGAKLWEIRAANSLARLWRDQGKRTEARDLLVPIYGCFTEGFDTPVLQDAKALLGELA
jgi:predicted ATPase